MVKNSLNKQYVARRKGKLSPLQIAKSEATRLHVLNTTIKCLAERPASAVSIALISKYANVSRGGMQYHFTTRMALLSATVGHLHQRRRQQLRDDLHSITPGKDVIGHIIDTYWKHLNERDFLAYQELVLAGRSDPALARLLAPKYRAFLHE